MRQGGFVTDYLLDVARASRKIVLFCLVIAIATGVYSMLVKPRFTSSALLMVPAGTSDGMTSLLAGAAGGALGRLGGNLGNLLHDQPSTPAADLAFQVLTSRVTLEEVIERHDLIPLLKAPNMYEAVKRFSRRVSIYLTPEGFISVTVQGWTAEGAAELAADLIEISSRRMDELVTSLTRKARIEAESTLVVARDSLDAVRLRLEDFMNETGVILPEVQAEQALAVIGEIETLLARARMDYAGLAATMSGSSPYSVSALRQIDLLESLLASRLGQGDSLSAMPGLAETPGLLSGYEQLRLELETRTAVYILLRQEYERLLIDENRESPTLEVLVPPVPHYKRSFPRRKAMVLKNTALALLVALAWMLAVSYMRRVARDEQRSAIMRSVSGEFRRQLFTFRRR
ncbi:hypothetical protein JW921_05625 [Candidatus Fermentibacterales bacterium]|nr:hypothetical protein [Candidatus Fermentibacterales bacterium]